MSEMVVRMKTGKTVRGALTYNETKVSRGEAELLLAAKFGCEIQSLGFTEKLNRFERLNSRSQTVKTNTLHLSLNFSPNDNLDNQKLKDVATDYMNRIGFGDQPFLVYRHDDTTHPHIHILTSVIKSNGRPINIHNIAKLKSEPARKEIEIAYNLIQAESMKREIVLPVYPASLLEALDYSINKHTISNIVREITSKYHFTSIDELNAILKDYNIIADRGIPGSRMWENEGLVYARIYDNKKIGTPIKSSSIYGQPTLKFLEKKFKKDIDKKHLYSARTSEILKQILQRPQQITEHQLKQNLIKRKITCHLTRDNYGALQSIQFIDHLSKTALNLEDLKIPIDAFQNKVTQKTESETHNHQADIHTEISYLTLKLLKGILTNENDGNGTANEFLKKKRKKRKRN